MSPEEMEELFKQTDTKHTESGPFFTTRLVGYRRGREK